MKIAFLTDIHIGADGSGYHQQTPWIDGWPKLMEALKKQLLEQEVELVLYGGDLSDHGVREEYEQGFASFNELGQTIRQASGEQGAGVVMVTGNKDCLHPESAGHWRAIGEAYSQTIALGDVHLEFDDFDLYALNNHYHTSEGIKPHWTKGDAECLTAEQLAWLEAGLKKFKDRPALVMMHHSMEGLKPEVTGQAEVIVGATAAYESQVNGLLDRYPHVLLSLSGHCHGTAGYGFMTRMNLTTSAFSEAPYEYRLIEVHEKAIAVSMQRIDLKDAPKADPQKAWVQGRQLDRAFILPACMDC